MPKGLRIPEEPRETEGKVIGVGNRPQRCTIPGEDDCLPAFHPVDDGVRVRPAVENQRDMVVAVGQRWPDSDEREVCFARCRIEG